MMTTFKNWLVVPIAISVVTALAASTSAALISFEYTQTDKDTGFGTLSGVVNGITFKGDMPKAEVSQNDQSGLPVPAGMIGYMDGAASGQPGNDFGVYLGWNGSVTLKGEKQISTTELGLYELDVPLVIAADGTPEAEWRYETELTDDGGNGNDAFGTGFRIAGWIGDPTDGHRHSAGAFGNFLEGAVDTRTIVGTHGDVGSNGENDSLGIAISLRNGTFDDGSGPIYVDNLIWQGGLTIDGSTNPEEFIGNVPIADIDGNGKVEFADFLILGNNFNLTGTTRATGDLNADGSTNLRDFVIFRGAFGAAAGAAAAVPEPSAALLLLLGGLGLAAKRRRRWSA